jgi:hypothetical protein
LRLPAPNLVRLWLVHCGLSLCFIALEELLRNHHFAEFTRYELETSYSDSCVHIKRPQRSASYVTRLCGQRALLAVKWCLYWHSRELVATDTKRRPALFSHVRFMFEKVFEHETNVSRCIEGHTCFYPPPFTIKCFFGIPSLCVCVCVFVWIDVSCGEPSSKKCPPERP